MQEILRTLSQLDGHKPIEDLRLLGLLVPTDSYSFHLCSTLDCIDGYQPLWSHWCSLCGQWTTLCINGCVGSVLTSCRALRESLMITKESLSTLLQSCRPHGRPQNSLWKKAVSWAWWSITKSTGKSLSKQSELRQMCHSCVLTGHLHKKHPSQIQGEIAGSH